MMMVVTWYKHEKCCVTMLLPYPFSIHLLLDGFLGGASAFSLSQLMASGRAILSKRVIVMWGVWVNDYVQLYLGKIKWGDLTGLWPSRLVYTPDGTSRLTRTSRKRWEYDWSVLLVTSVGSKRFVQVLSLVNVLTSPAYWNWFLSCGTEWSI